MLFPIHVSKGEQRQSPPRPFILSGLEGIPGAQCAANAPLIRPQLAFSLLLTRRMLSLGQSPIAVTLVTTRKCYYYAQSSRFVMAITAAEARVWHAAPHQVDLLHFAAY